MQQNSQDNYTTIMESVTISMGRGCPSWHREPRRRQPKGPTLAKVCALVGLVASVITVISALT